MRLLQTILLLRLRQGLRLLKELETGRLIFLLPVIILSIFWKGYSEVGAITSMVTGFGAVIFFKFVFVNMEGLGEYFKELDVLAPAFALAMLAGFVASKLFPPKRVEAS